MFTIDQIRAAHSKVKSGADFPRYIEEIRALGVKGYVYYVADGHTDYGPVSSPARYETKSIAPVADQEKLEKALKLHQAGGSDFPTFCAQAAEFGVYMWKVDTTERTCVYYDQSGNEIIKETF